MAMKKLAPDIAFILRNQHTIMLSLSKLMSATPCDPSAFPVLMHQIKMTDEAIGMNRAKDD